MAVPPVSTRPPVKRDEPTPTATTPTSAAVPPAPAPTPATPIPTTPPVQAIYLCSAYCFQDNNYEFQGQTFGSSTNDVIEAQAVLRSSCEERYQRERKSVNRDGSIVDNIYRKTLNFDCKIHFIPPAVRICHEPPANTIPEKTGNGK